MRKNGAFVLTAQDYNYGGHTQLCLAPQFQSDPVSVWNNDAGNYFLIYDNYALKPSAELVGRLRHQILMLNKGDVNQDSFITIADVTALVNIILGKASSSTENVNNAADVNDDDAITIADVTALVNIILGMDSTVPYLYDHQAADVNGDDSITIADVTSLVNIILGTD